MKMRKKYITPVIDNYFIDLTESIMKGSTDEVFSKENGITIEDDIDSGWEISKEDLWDE